MPDMDLTHIRELQPVAIGVADTRTRGALGRLHGAVGDRALLPALAVGNRVLAHGPAGRLGRPILAMPADRLMPEAGLILTGRTLHGAAGGGAAIQSSVARKSGTTCDGGMPILARAAAGGTKHTVQMPFRLL